MSCKGTDELVVVCVTSLFGEEREAGLPGTTELSSVGRLIVGSPGAMSCEGTDDKLVVVSATSLLERRERGETAEH